MRPPSQVPRIQKRELALKGVDDRVYDGIDPSCNTPRLSFGGHLQPSAHDSLAYNIELLNGNGKLDGWRGAEIASDGYLP